MPRLRRPHRPRGRRLGCANGDLRRPEPQWTHRRQGVSPHGAAHEVKLQLPGTVNLGNAATALAVAARFGVAPADAAPGSARSPASPAGTPRSSATGGNIRLLLAKNPASWLEAFEMADDAPTLLSINARDPDGLDTSWLYDVDFAPLRGRQVLITGDRAYGPRRPAGGQRRPVHPRDAFAAAVAAVPRGGWRSSPTTPRSRTSERSLIVLSKLQIVWVYPDLLSTYGDRGNMLILGEPPSMFSASA